MENGAVKWPGFPYENDGEMRERVEKLLHPENGTVSLSLKDDAVYEEMAQANFARENEKGKKKDKRVMLVTHVAPSGSQTELEQEDPHSPVQTNDDFLFFSR
jgi:hypothetical protein